MKINNLLLVGISSLIHLNAYSAGPVVIIGSGENKSVVTDSTCGPGAGPECNKLDKGIDVVPIDENIKIETQTNVFQEDKIWDGVERSGEVKDLPPYNGGGGGFVAGDTCVVPSIVGGGSPSSSSDCGKKRTACVGAICVTSKGEVMDQKGNVIGNAKLGPDGNFILSSLTGQTLGTMDMGGQGGKDANGNLTTTGNPQSITITSALEGTALAQEGTFTGSTFADTTKGIITIGDLTVQSNGNMVDTEGQIIAVVSVDSKTGNFNIDFADGTQMGVGSIDVRGGAHYDPITDTFSTSGEGQTAKVFGREYNGLDMWTSTESSNGSGFGSSTITGGGTSSLKEAGRY